MIGTDDMLKNLGKNIRALRKSKKMTIDQLAEKSFEFCKLLFAILEQSLILSQHKADTIRFETATERYLRTLRDFPDIIRRAPLHYVASYLQMTPETLSRVRSSLTEADLAPIKQKSNQ